MKTPTNIRFEKIDKKHQKTIFEWLEEPHMKEFWDNSQEHKDDILNFINGRIELSNYFDGVFTYWVGTIENEPYSFILSSEVNSNEKYPPIWRDHISTTGTTYSIDFGIGNPLFIGQGLAAPTLKAFMHFFHTEVDPKADTFFIDPDANNPRAQHVYVKAGFDLVGNFKAEKKYGDFSGEETYLMVKKM